MDGQAPQRRISNVTAFFMIFVALLLDLVQFLLTISVLLAILTDLVTFLALCIFGVWFAVMGINYFSGRKSGMKLASVLGSTIVELVPVLDALPVITVGVIGVIVSSRLEDAEQSDGAKKQSSGGASAIRFGPSKVPTK